MHAREQDANAGSSQRGAYARYYLLIPDQAEEVDNCANTSPRQSFGPATWHLFCRQPGPPPSPGC